MIYSRYSVGAVIRNRSTREDGKIIRVFVDDGAIKYDVAVPVDQCGWQLGTKHVTDWDEEEVSLQRTRR